MDDWNDEINWYQGAYIQFFREEKNVYNDIIECVKFYYRYREK